ncbi:hypothetical protein [Yersinia phage fHe-Yen9-04]|uniref:Uncharacterized protein n=1 Tax=Yersinia phage fHe-Yen9-04 TaxID=2052742 RepID=A0A2C9CY63_9CAUD|nr:hypothetical protein FDJ41_gp454 [Yersinia phage fHe-Yen9-04]SOK58726.1 hypothetical protein [Yersinia phage fHe-Yen9-04]VUE36495.1 hypothetical protein [Yersinia phage fHe-Yen9-04]
MHPIDNHADIIDDVITEILEIYTCKVEVYNYGNLFSQHGYSTKHNINYHINAKYYNNNSKNGRRANSLVIEFKFTNRVPKGLKDYYRLSIPEIQSITEERHFQLMLVTDDMYLDYEVINKLRTHIM